MMQMMVLAYVVHSKKKKSEDNKKKYETKPIRKFQPAWPKEFDWVVYQEETNIFFWTSSFVVRTSKIHIVLVPRDK